MGGDEDEGPMGVSADALCDEQCRSVIEKVLNPGPVQVGGHTQEQRLLLLPERSAAAGVTAA